ncbi:MAG: hypothetical protein CSA81_01370 [Acidobacteria bacterium]|nr:MAG: hypothetical protein CSA81_01370 [Acidobacteriota bacterium]
MKNSKDHTRTYVPKRSPKRGNTRNASSNLGNLSNHSQNRTDSSKKSVSISLSGNPPAAQKTWWSQKFIHTLETLKLGNRLIRGREYAKEGRVQRISLAPGQVTSLVNGSRKTPYVVSISIEPIPENTWKKISYDIAKRAIFVIEMLQDRMPESVDEVFHASRIGLFPSHVKQLRSHCDCQDEKNPCKHIAATYYILAQHFDLDPFLIFTLRGRTKSQILDFLQYFWKKGRPKLAQQMSGIPKKKILPKEVKPFWNAPHSDKVQSKLDPLSPALPDTLVKKLGPAPITLDDVNLEAVLSDTYQYISDTIREWAIKKQK